MIINMSAIKILKLLFLLNICVVLVNSIYTPSERHAKKTSVHHQQTNEQVLTVHGSYSQVKIHRPNYSNLTSDTGAINHSNHQRNDPQEGISSSEIKYINNTNDESIFQGNGQFNQGTQYGESIGVKTRPRQERTQNLNDLTNHHPGIECPPSGSGQFIYILDCRQFLNCWKGRGYIQPCAGGTLFNPETLECDFASKVNCLTPDFDTINRHENYNIPVASLSVNENRQEFLSLGSSGRQSEGRREVKCPPSSAGLLPHPFDCAKFLNCANGQTFIQDCGPGTVFNPRISVCDWPYNVDCNTTANDEDYATPRPTQRPVYIPDYDTFTGSSNNPQGGSFINRSPQYVGAQSHTYPIYHRNFSRPHTNVPSTESYTHQTSQGGTSGQSFGSSSTNQGSVNQNYPRGHYQPNANQGSRDLDQSQSTYYGNNNYNQQNRKPIPPYPTEKTDTEYEDFEISSVSTQNRPLNVIPLRPSISYIPDGCNQTFFRCDLATCMPQAWLCDGEKDCSNGRDELFCADLSTKYIKHSRTKLNEYTYEITNYTLNACFERCLSLNTFVCRSLSYNYVDNICYLNEQNIATSGRISAGNCDHYELTTFSTTCGGNFRCDNGNCLDFNDVCNAVNNCGDNSDEKNCQEFLGYDIRLGGSQLNNEGRVEVKVFGQWGYVCDDNFGIRDADVICKELGFEFGALEVRSNSYYPINARETNPLILMDGLSCLGNETSIRECRFEGWGIHDCTPEEIAGLVCRTPVASCPKDHWLCDTTAECIPTSFLCDSVNDCNDNSDESPLHCNNDVELRLVGGSSPTEGRVEIKYRGIWGTVCDDDFTNKAARVICRSLGYGGEAFAKKEGYFGPGSGQIWLDQVSCRGNETSIDKCSHWHWGENNCEHNEDAGVICNPGEVIYEEQQSVDSTYGFVDDNYLQMARSSNIIPEECGRTNDDIFAESSEVAFRVIQGSVVKKGAYPWQASIRVRGNSKSTHWCGAIIVTQLHVLTAAHCLTAFSKGAYFIRVGDHNTQITEDSEAEMFIEDIYIHEDFRKGQTMNNDIALVKLKTPIVFNEWVKPICLPPSDAEYTPGRNCTISGWGSVQSGKSSPSNELRAGWVPIQSREVCRMPHVYGNSIMDGMICAGTLDEGVDACDGDSGGPLACLYNGAYTAFGITSWGLRCGDANKPGVYVKVAYYKDWIETRIHESVAGEQ